MTKEAQPPNLPEELALALARLNEKEFKRLVIGKVIHDLRNLATPITMIAELLKMENSPVPIESLHDDLMETLQYLTAAVDELQECRKTDASTCCDPNRVCQDYRPIFDAVDIRVNRNAEADETCEPCEINVHRMDLAQMILCIAGAAPDSNGAKTQWELSTQQDDAHWTLVLTGPDTQWPDEFMTKLIDGRIGWHDSYPPNWMTLQSLVATGRGDIAVNTIDHATRCAISFKLNSQK